MYRPNDMHEVTAGWVQVMEMSCKEIQNLFGMTICSGKWCTDCDKIDYNISQCSGVEVVYVLELTSKFASLTQNVDSYFAVYEFSDITTYPILPCESCKNSNVQRRMFIVGLQPLQLALSLNAAEDAYRISTIASMIRVLTSSGFAYYSLLSFIAWEPRHFVAYGRYGDGINGYTGVRYDNHTKKACMYPTEEHLVLGIYALIDDDLQVLAQTYSDVSSADIERGKLVETMRILIEGDSDCEVLSSADIESDQGDSDQLDSTVGPCSEGKGATVTYDNDIVFIQKHKTGETPITRTKLSKTTG